MRKLFTLFALSFCLQATAQYVNIPDSNFRNFLIGQYPNCFNAAKQMDTTCTAILNEKVIICRNTNISNVDGIQFFINLVSIDFSKNKLKSIIKLPNKLSSMDVSSNQIDSIKNLPKSLRTLVCSTNQLINLPILPDSLSELTCSKNKLTSLPLLPSTLQILDISYNNISSSQIILPDSLQYFNCRHNTLVNLPILPANLGALDCGHNLLNTLPSLPNLLGHLNCDSNRLTSLPLLPDTLEILFCVNNLLNSIQNIPRNLWLLSADNNQLTTLPSLTSNHLLGSLECRNNKLTSLPDLSCLTYLVNIDVFNNPYLSCLPKLPQNPYSTAISFDSSVIKCLPNLPIGCDIYFDTSLKSHQSYPICNPTNNINQCTSFPMIKGYVFLDSNKNGKWDANELGSSKIKVSIANNKSTFTNHLGYFEILTDSIGTYDLLIESPSNNFNSNPPKYTHTFTTFSTLVSDTFALQLKPIVIDSVTINVVPAKRYARPGFNFSYLIAADNVGTTTLNTTITFAWDTAQLILDSIDNIYATNNSNKITILIDSFYSNQFKDTKAYFTVKPTASLGHTIPFSATITGGNAIDSVKGTTIIRSSYDPNDKQATPNLSVAQVSDNNHYIDYTIRFQNTGTDTAFTVVIADTLNTSKLQISSLQITGGSPNLKATQNDNIVFFEFRNINLPDSNTNKMGSNGFVSFRVKPLTTLTNGEVVPNKAAIYFDYNTPVITNVASTIISSGLPLQLLGFGAVPKPESNTVFVYWNTANEINTSHFIIEQSHDGKAFTACAEVAAKGKGSNSYYNQLTVNRQQSIVFLRLKMIDKDGKFVYSNVVKLPTNSLNNNFITVISPAKNELKIIVTVSSLHNSQAQLVTTQGKVVKQFNLQKGLTTIDIATLPKGVYYVKTNATTQPVVID